MSNQFLNSYLSFTKKERRGIITLLILIIFFIALPFFYGYFIKPRPIDDTDFNKEIAALEIKRDSLNRFAKQNLPSGDEDNYRHYNEPSEKNYRNIPKGQLFYFDPNTTSDTEWERLGVREKTVGTIKNYLSKGGHFYKPEDIGKIWGLHQNEIERLMPYVRIAARENSYTAHTYEPKIYDKPKYSATTIDINNADTSAFISLPGIGSKLAYRIVSFREKLGGFYSVAQVGETYGLADSTFQKIKSRLTVNGSTVHQFNINTAGIDELKVHPLIKYNLANAIVQYRMQHGNYKTVMDVKNIMTVTDEIYNKLVPYLKVE
jgi:competence protein ComEA